MQRNQEALAGLALRFELTASDPALEIQDHPFGPVLLATEPQASFERIYERLSYAEPGSEDTVRADCATLGEELLPPELQKILWHHRCEGGTPKTLWICSEEMWIPWEILVLKGRIDDRWKAGPTLGEAFAVTRGRPGLARRPWLPLRTLAAVFAARSGLSGLPEERSFLKSLSGPVRRVDVLASARDEVLKAMEHGEYDGWHLAGHGSWDAGEASFDLGGEKLGPSDIAYAAPNLGRSRPLVFVNACHLARSGQGLVHWNGWAAKLADLQVGAFIGALWPTDDRAALIFARIFYERFLGGATLASAVHTARRAAKEGVADDISWLAFVAYGDPSACCMAGPEAVPLVEPPAESNPLLEDRQPMEIRSRRRRQSARHHLAGPVRQMQPLGLFMLASALLFASLTGLRSPTRIRLEARASALEVTLAANPSDPLFDSGLPFSHLEARRFARAEIREGVARPPVKSLRAESPAAALIVKAQQASGETDGLWPSHVTTLEDLELLAGSRLALRAQPIADSFDLGLTLVPKGSLRLPLFDPFAIESTGVAPVGKGGDASAATPTGTRASAADAGSFLTLFPIQEGIELAGIVGPAATRVPLLAEPLAISTLDLMNFDGEVWRSSLLAEAKLSFPRMPERETVAIPADHFLRLGDFREFNLQRLSLDLETGGLWAVFEGLANEVRSGLPGAIREHRPSYYERWLGSPLWSWWIAWLAGSGTVFFGATKLRRRLWKTSR